jgi:N-acetylglucosamine malate deacetylase 1
MILDALFLAAHPDDVELFCGATAAKLGASGAHVELVDLTAGEKASNGTVQGRRKASLEALRLLGARGERPVLGLPDGGLDSGDEGQLGQLVEFLEEHPSRLLFAPWPDDRHPDHVAAGEMARVAQRLLGERRAEQLLFYAAHRGVPEHLYVDVTEQMEAWLGAVNCYADQFAATTDSIPTPINRPDFLPAQKERRRQWGRESGFEFAEAFALDDATRRTNALDLLGEVAS